ncbi:purple acid phosphatase 27 [Striga asiatica]|uniref:Purple acid phosphatase n=1 Tax=Striga asiatica TaxID=4170 RepID=A0A5A7QEU9_STRAF|nr:purple acid phosphatase 27 [Striga asiatica]
MPTCRCFLVLPLLMYDSLPDLEHTDETFANMFKFFPLTLMFDFRYSAMKDFLKLLVVLWATVSLEEVISHGIQPLSTIAIQNAVIDLDSKAYIKASPSVLGVNLVILYTIEFSSQGENKVSIEVDYSSPNPSSDDWIGVFSPANFSSATCVAENPRVGPPYLCTAPIKYQFANFSNPKYEKTGKGSLKLQLINQRADFSFALFSGGVSNPKLVAVSNVVAFANPNAPLYPRLAQGKTWNEMTVTWTSGYNIDEAEPFVEWGPKGGEQKRSLAVTLTFDRNSMCGAPARTVGWRDPGLIHTSFLKELWPNSVYTYKLGHKLLNGSYAWSAIYEFKASPYPGQNSVQRVIVFGDMGKDEADGSNEYNNFERGSLNTTKQLIRDLNNYDIVFHIGDICYANGYLSQWDQFTSQVEPIASKVPYMIARYSTDYGMFRFCIADTEHDWREGSKQYKFIEHCLASVDRQKQPWLIFMAHRVLGYSSDETYANEGSFAEPMGRDNLQKLWQRYKVDIAFFGHVHSYERTCPVYQNKCTREEKNYYKGSLNGTIHVVAGGGGASLSKFSTLKPNWSIFRDSDYGFVKLTAFDHSNLLFEYKKSQDGKVYDSFRITRDYRDILACAVDSCPSTTLAT